MRQLHRASLQSHTHTALKTTQNTLATPWQHPGNDQKHARILVVFFPPNLSSLNFIILKQIAIFFTSFCQLFPRLAWRPWFPFPDCQKFPRWNVITLDSNKKTNKGELWDL